MYYQPLEILPTYKWVRQFLICIRKEHGESVIKVGQKVKFYLFSFLFFLAGPKHLEVPRTGIKTTPQQQLKLLQGQCQTSTRCDTENSKKSSFRINYPFNSLQCSNSL